MADPASHEAHTPSETRLRRAARERALELLYEAEVKQVDVDELLDALPIAPAELAVELVRGVEGHRARIDEHIRRRVGPSWSVERLAVVDRAVLRLAAYELLAAPQRSRAVILNEAVVLARTFGSDDSSRFVNGVLSAIATDVRPDEDDAAHIEAGDDEGDGVAPSVDALVMDLDGVIRHWDPASLFEDEDALGLPRGTILRAALEPGLFDRAMRGELTADEWYVETGTAVARQHAVDAAAVAQAFSGVGWRIDQMVIDLVNQARRRVPVALLSNASSRLVDDLRASDILDCFDVVVGSAELGACKPEAVVFAAASERLDVALERCLLVDDRRENVDAARQLGMLAEQFTSVDHLARRLERAGLINRVSGGGDDHSGGDASPQKPRE